ncbi:MAG: MFS transporter [Dehalococcoidia bacterium]|nr:MFS transporter [Dehalococcoidia bacterium]
MFSRAFVVLFIAMFVAMAGVGMVSPLLPVYVRDDLGGPAVGVALSFSGLAIAQIISAPFAGSFGDRYGLKPFIVGGFAIYALGAFGYLFANTWEMVVFFRVLSGFGAAGVFPMTLAYIGRLAPPGREGSYMGGFTVAQVTGFGLGPLLGGGIRDAFNSETAFATMGIMLAGTALLTLLWLPPKPGLASLDGIEEPSLPWSQIVRRRAVQGAVLFMTLMSLGWGAAYSFIAIFVTSEEGLGLDSALFVGILLSLRQLTNAALQPITGRLADRVDRVKLVSIGLVLMAVGTGLIPLVPDTTIEVGPVPLAVFLLLTVVISGVGESLAMPAQQAVFVTLGRVVGMGSLMGLNNMGNSVGFLFGSLVGAAVVSSMGLGAVFIFAAVLLLGGMFIYVAIMRSAARELEQAAEAARRAEALEAERNAEALENARAEAAV